MTPDDPSDVSRQFNALGQLASGVGHHVINAFAAIVSNAEILRLTHQLPAPIEPSAVADLIIKTAVEASTVARRLIDFSRAATATGGDLVEFDKLASSFIDEERQRGPDEILWRADLAPVPPIRGDVQQLREMLGHLTSNAREAMQATGGVISIATSLDDRGWVVIEVRDSGAGVTPDVQERAVEPFFTTKPGHLGVGLSIANGIWRRHRGTLAVRGRPGEGTCVRLCVEPDHTAHAAGESATSPHAARV